MYLHTRNRAKSRRDNEGGRKHRLKKIENHVTFLPPQLF